MRFDVTDLRLFLAVAEAGSITHGARRCHMALASASARVLGMEEALGVALLERGRRGVRPTPAGQALIHHATLVLHQMERMRGELSDYAKGLKGHVRLQANTAALTEFLPDALAAFLAAHPGVDIDVEERPSHAIVRAVASGFADLGVVADHADTQGLETLPFREDRLVLAVPRGHPLAARRTVAFGELAGQPFVGLLPGSALQEHLDRQAARAGHALSFRVRVPSPDAVCRMVAHGVGIGVIPQTAVHRSRRRTALRAVRLSDAWALRRLTLCARRFDHLPTHARQLVDQLRSDRCR